jgi:sugar phosphate isomerase/epimerase
MKLGVYSLSAPDLQIEECAALLADIGYTGVEWTVDYAGSVWDGSKWHINTDARQESVARVRQACGRHGLAVACLCPRLGAGERERVVRMLELAAEVGAEFLRVQAPGYRAGERDANEVFAQGRRDYQAAIDAARDVGVRILVELHPGLITPGVTAALRLLEGLDPNWVGVMHDPGNMVKEGIENWQMGCELLGPYLQHVHVKDRAWLRDEDGTWSVKDVPLGEGCVDWPAFVGALKAVGYRGYLDIEDFRGGYGRAPEGITTREKLQQDYDYLQELLG